MSWMTHEPLLEGSTTDLRALELPWFVLFLALKTPKSTENLKMRRDSTPRETERKVSMR